DRCGVVAERLVKMIVIVLGFAEVVDDVAEMEQKGGTIGERGTMEVVRDVICHAEFGAELPDNGGAGIAGGVKDDLSGVLNGLYVGWPVSAKCTLECEEVPGVGP